MAHRIFNLANNLTLVRIFIVPLLIVLLLYSARPTACLIAALLFGLAAFVVMMHLGRCLAAGALTLALLVLPLVISSAEEALRQLPPGLREGSLALGATRWQTIRRVVLPNAMPGIMTGLILSVGRAAGETAPILFTAAFYSLTDPFPNSLFDEIVALPYQLFVMATEAPDVSDTTMWATAVVLVALVLSMNLVATIFRARLRRRAGR